MTTIERRVGELKVADRFLMHPTSRSARFAPCIERIVRSDELPERLVQIECLTPQGRAAYRLRFDRRVQVFVREQVDA